MKRIALVLSFFFLTQVLYSQASEHTPYRSNGLDLEVLSLGGSFGGFLSSFRHPALSLDAEADWVIVESNDSYTFYNTGLSPSPFETGISAW